MLITAPLYASVYLGSTAYMSFFWLIFAVGIGNFYQATSFSQTQGIVEIRMRSVAAAILLFIINIIGLGLGPQFVGILSDYLRPTYGNESLRYSLLILSTLKIWSAYHYYLAGKHLKNDLITD
jgi:hypothetical protein